MTTVRRVATEDLSRGQLAAIRETVWAAFAGDPDAFTKEDWAHALGGIHFLLDENGKVAAHASVVERELEAGDHRLRTGYVEAVATRPDAQGRGLGSAVMHAVGEYIDQAFVLGALDTGVQAFYERLGWLVWKGPTFVRKGSGLLRTAEDDGNVMVRLTPQSPELDLWTPLSCEWRSGDVW